MSSSSRQRVTITLGRSGKVVKRDPISDSDHFDHIPMSGRKRSVRERLGNNRDDFIKRQRRESDDSQYGPSDIDYKVGKYDLRMKLDRKGVSQRNNGLSRENGTDLREKLHWSSRSSSRYDGRGRLPERDPGPRRRIPPTRSADDLSQLDLMRKPYNTYLPGPRYRSPDRLVDASRGVPQPRNYDAIRPGPRGEPVRSLHSSRPSSVLMRDVYEKSVSMPYVNEAPSSVVAPQTIPRGHPSESVLKHDIMEAEQAATENFMLSLGLHKYYVILRAEEVDMHALRQMGDKDLKDLGIPMGPRKKILLALGAK